MPRKAKGLTAAGVSKAKPGRHADGRGLFLFVKPDGRRTWTFRFQIDGRAREMGLGVATGTGAISLSQARDKAGELHQLVKQRIDPLDKRSADEADAKAAAQLAEAKRKTFRDVTSLYIAAHEASWRNAKHAAQWTATLKTYAFPHFGDLPVAGVSVEHVMSALEPIWTAKPETASRVRGRIESVLDFAAARNWRDGDNPARWRGRLSKLLPARTKVRKVEHHAAIPWREMPSFMTRLRQQQGVGALALEFAVLTAARTGEVIGATWGEVDLDDAVWRVPGERMKGGREHRVPLTEAAVAVLRQLLPLRDAGRGDWVFVGAKPGRSLSNMSLLMTLRRMGLGAYTAHGTARSSFRTWAAEGTSFAPEVAEAALAHVNGDKVAAAYQRGDFFDKRRRLMEAWSEFCGRMEAPAGDVVPLRCANG